MGAVQAVADDRLLDDREPRQGLGRARARHVLRARRRGDRRRDHVAPTRGAAVAARGTVPQRHTDRRVRVRNRTFPRARRTRAVRPRGRRRGAAAHARVALGDASRRACRRDPGRGPDGVRARRFRRLAPARQRRARQLARDRDRRSCRGDPVAGTVRDHRRHDGRGLHALLPGADVGRRRAERRFPAPVRPGCAARPDGLVPGVRLHARRRADVRVAAAPRDHLRPVRPRPRVGPRRGDRGGDAVDAADPHPDRPHRDGVERRARAHALERACSACAPCT